MTESVPLSADSVNFILQIRGLKSWLEGALTGAGITGVRAERAVARLVELEAEIVELCNLIYKSVAIQDGTVLKTCSDFDAAHILPEDLAARADAGIQDLGANIQEELVAFARGRKKQLEDKQPVTTDCDAPRAAVWLMLSSCDCIEEIGATVLRVAESARYLFQTEALRRLPSVLTLPAQ